MSFSLELSADVCQVRDWVHEFAADVIRPAAEVLSRTATELGVHDRRDVLRDPAPLQVQLEGGKCATDLVE